MTTPTPSIELPKEKQITNDLKEEYKTILEKHLDGRTLKEDKINSWMNNILSDAKEYFLKNIRIITYFCIYMFVQKMFIFILIQALYH